MAIALLVWCVRVVSMNNLRPFSQAINVCTVVFIGIVGGILAFGLTLLSGPAARLHRPAGRTVREAKKPAQAAQREAPHFAQIPAQL
jgi:hypothetical protein